MMNEEHAKLLLDFGYEFFRIVNPGGIKWDCRFSFGKGIPGEAIAGIQSIFNTLDLDVEEPLFYIRNTLSGSLENGILFTTDMFYYNLVPNISQKYVAKQVTLDELFSFEIRPNMLASDLWINGEKVAFVEGWFKINDYEAKILSEFVSWVIKIRQAIRDTHEKNDRLQPGQGYLAASQIDKLIYLNSMYKKGIFSDEEYAIARNRIVIHMVAERRVENDY